LKLCSASDALVADDSVSCPFDEPSSACGYIAGSCWNIQQLNYLENYGESRAVRRTDCQLVEQFDHIENSALKNKMIINNAKIKEFLGLIRLNLVCLTHLMALLRSVLLSF